MRISNPGSVAAFAAVLMFALPSNQSLAIEAPAESGWRQVAYRCESGQALTVDFRESGSAVRVTASDKPAVQLVSRPARLGFRYGDSRYELRGEGDAVTWQIGSKTPLKCTSDDPAAGKLAAATR